MGEFDRMAFKQCGERIFDQHFQFDRELRETMAYANVQKNGNLEQRLQMDVLATGERYNTNKEQVKELATGISNRQYVSPEHMMSNAGMSVGKFLDILLSEPYIVAPAHNEHPKRKKKKKSQSQVMSK